MADLKPLAEEWKSNPDKPVHLIAYGSSNTELSWHSLGRHNWVDWLNCSLRGYVGKQVSLINQGVCGDTTDSLLQRLKRDVLSFSPMMVLITIGGNDAGTGMAPEKFESNLRILCQQLLERNILPVIQSYYCPLYDEMPKEFEVFPFLIEIDRKLASEFQVPLIDQYRYFEPMYRKIPEKYKTLFKDGLHLNPLGNAVMGIIAVRYFGLPDPVLPPDMEASIREALILMNACSPLPPQLPNP
jgi:lysophospholipase L1-like esterase